MKTKYDYYDVEVPDDLVAQCNSNDYRPAFYYACDEARERAKLYVIPCRWTFVYLKGNICRVCRTRKV